MRALGALLVLAGALAGCGGERARERRSVPVVADERAPAEGAALPGRPPTRGERQALGRLAADAEHVRGLRFLRPVPVRVQTASEITAFVRERIDREELERARVFYVALGLLPADLDVERMLLAVMGEQIVGYYDPEQALLVVRDDVLRELAHGEHVEGATVLVHELVHALQDQHLDLRALYDVERSIDGANAFASLVEGDAVLTMIGWGLHATGGDIDDLTADPVELRRRIALGASARAHTELEAAPPIVRVPLLSRYVDGLVFCAHLHHARGFRAIDAAFRRPPASTEQLLHQGAYARAEAPEAITLPELAAFEAAGLRPHDEDTLGELEMGVYFALGTPLARDEPAAAGWGGDRVRVYVREDGSTAVLWLSTWDDEAEAIEAEGSAVRVASLAPGGPMRGHLVQRRGRALLIARDLDAALHPIAIDALDALAASLAPSARAAPTVLDGAEGGG